MKSNKLTLSIDVLLSIFAFIIFVIKFIQLKNLILIDKYALQNVFMHNQEPIQELRTGRSLCIEDEVPLINFTFFGINDLCYNKSNQTVINCTEDNKKEEEVGIVKEIKQKDLNIWRDKNICVKRTNKTVIKESKFVNFDEKCPNNTKQCGFINNHTKKFCLNTTIANECPINFLKITNETISEDYKSFDLSQDFKIYYSHNNDNGNLFGDFKASEGKYPCVIPNRRSFNYSQFPRLRNFGNYGCNSSAIEKENEVNENEGLDKRYHELDKISKSYFFRDNELDLEYSSIPNLYFDGKKWENDFNNSFFILFYRDYYIQKWTFYDYENFEKNVSEAREILFARLCISLGNLILMAIIISVVNLMKVFRNLYHTLAFLILLIICYTYVSINFVFLFGKEKGQSKVMKEFIDNFLSKKNENDINVKCIIFGLEMYKIQEKINYFESLIRIEVFCNIFYIVFALGLTGRFVNKVYVRYKNRYRRNIVDREIGNEKLQNILEEYREKEKKKKTKKKRQ